MIEIDVVQSETPDERKTEYIWNVIIFFLYDRNQRHDMKVTRVIMPDLVRCSYGMKKIF